MLSIDTVYLARSRQHLTQSEKKHLGNRWQSGTFKCHPVWRLYTVTQGIATHFLATAYMAVLDVCVGEKKSLKKYMYIVLYTSNSLGLFINLRQFNPTWFI